MKIIFKLLFLISSFAAYAENKKPNIIYILADDWGLGDIKTYGGERCKINTPHMDKLAEQGMKFTDAHSSSSVCTPSRYSVMTGRYNWRSRMKSGVFFGFSSPLIENDRETVASMLKQNGYATCMIGKWHLGMDFASTDGNKVKQSGSNVDWTAKIENGPRELGFDYFWGIAASLDMPPYVWIENDSFVGAPTVKKGFPRKGPAHVDFEAIDVLPELTKRTCSYIAENATKDRPFFIYMSLNSPHTPILPSKEFQGKSKLGPYADFVMQTDWSIGQVVKAVEDAGINENTLIIVTADNGYSPAANESFRQEQKLKFLMDKPTPFDPDAHYPSDIYRGYKADIYEGGHRVPFIARWDGKIKAGSSSNQQTCLVDLFATCADIVGSQYDDNTAEDSFSILPAFLGRTQSPLREAVVHHSFNGSFAIRRGKWKLIFCPGSGGWSNPSPGGRKAKKGRIQVDPRKLKDHQWFQLFDMDADPSETTNLTGSHPEIVESLTQLMEKYIKNGRSTPGKTQSNDGDSTEILPKWIQKIKNK